MPVKTRTPCPKCGAKDYDGNNLVHHRDGSKHCYACLYHESKYQDQIKQGLKESSENKLIDRGSFVDDEIRPSFILDGTYESLRNISQETCELYKYQVATYYDRPVQVANFFKDGELISQNLRYEDKTFPWINYQKEDISLFGMETCLNFDEEIIITEGYIDAMTVRDSWGIQAVSLNKGAGSANDLTNFVEWLGKFSKIVIFFDADDPGQKAVEVIKQILPLGKTFVVHRNWGYHDANDALSIGDPGAILDAINNAYEVVPEGIIFGDMIDFSQLEVPEPFGYPIPYEDLNDMMRGVKAGRLIVVCAGTGVGKSSFLKEWVYSWLTRLPDLSIANIFLEENQRHTIRSYVALEKNIPTYKLEEDPSLVKDIASVGKSLLGRHNLTFLDHFGSLKSRRLLDLLEYLAVVKKMKVIMLDHISIAISGNESSREGERKDIDILMTKLRSLVERTGTSIVAVSHLTRPKGKGFEEGLPVTLNALRGSGSLSQIPDVVISLERNQQHSIDKDKTIVRVIKNRITGKLGVAQTLYFMENTGRLVDIKDSLCYSKDIQTRLTGEE